MSLRLKEIRISRGYSQVELAQKLSVSKQSVSNWENDNIQPSVEMLVKISKVLSVSTDFLLNEDSRRYIEVTGLSNSQLSHIQNVINDLRNANSEK